MYSFVFICVLISDKILLRFTSIIFMNNKYIELFIDKNIYDRCITYIHITYISLLILELMLLL
jgi:hypothetical protein